jgi:ferritin-like protein
LELAIQTYLDEYSEDSDILIEVKVDEEMCQVKKETALVNLDGNTKRVM